MIQRLRFKKKKDSKDAKIIFLINFMSLNSFYSPENIKKPKVFRGYRKTSGMKWVNTAVEFLPTVNTASLTSCVTQTPSYKHTNRSRHQRCYKEKCLLTNFTKFSGKYLCQSLSFNKVAACNFIKKDTLAKVFSCEF